MEEEEFWRVCIYTYYLYLQKHKMLTFFLKQQCIKHLMLCLFMENIYGWWCRKKNLNNTFAKFNKNLGSHNIKHFIKTINMELFLMIIFTLYSITWQVIRRWKAVAKKLRITEVITRNRYNNTQTYLNISKLFSTQSTE